MRTSFRADPRFRERVMAEHARAERAVTAVMRGAQTEIKTAWRQQITAAGLGRRLANTIRGATYPQGDVSLNAASLVWAKAPEIIDAHERGALIRSENGFWLAIPTEAAGRLPRGRRMTPLGWERQNRMPLRFVYRPGRAALLVADDARVNARGLARRKGGKRRKRDGILTGAQTVVVFVLVPQVKLKKRLDLHADATRVAAALPARLAAAWR